VRPEGGCGRKHRHAPGMPPMPAPRRWVLLTASWGPWVGAPLLMGPTWFTPEVAPGPTFCRVGPGAAMPLSPCIKGEGSPLFC